MWSLPLAAAVISGVFCSLLIRAASRRPRPHLVAWATALAMFALASGAAAVGMAAGWTTAWFRVYYLFGAIVNVPVLAAGSTYLLAPRRVGHLFAVAVAVLAIGAAHDVVTADLATEALATPGIPAGAEVVPAAVRSLSRYLSFGGFFVVVGGALWSAWRLARRGGTAARRLAAANLLIATGTFVVAVGSGFARYGRGRFFALGLAVGVTLMFAGFLKTHAAAPRAAGSGG
ncbi:MAG: hypothetical protein ABR575_02435 [Actinomycetota bacterium]